MQCLWSHFNIKIVIVYSLAHNEKLNNKSFAFQIVLCFTQSAFHWIHWAEWNPSVHLRHGMFAHFLLLVYFGSPLFQHYKKGCWSMSFISDEMFVHSAALLLLHYIIYFLKFSKVRKLGNHWNRSFVISLIWLS